MKSSTKRLFVIVLIVMSFVAVPAVFAGTGTEAHNYLGNQNDDPGKPDFEDPCIIVVTGCVTATGYRTIVLDYTTAIKTPIAFALPDVDEIIWVKYWVNPDGVKVACAWGFIDYCPDDEE
jgi:hypothetical protein